jgi:hypothetical protein
MSLEAKIEALTAALVENTTTLKAAIEAGAVPSSAKVEAPAEQAPAPVAAEPAKRGPGRPKKDAPAPVAETPKEPEAEQPEAEQPEAEQPVVPTREAVTAAAKAVVKHFNGGKDEAKALIKKHGGADLASLPEANLAAFIADCEATIRGDEDEL